MGGDRENSKRRPYKRGPEQDQAEHETELQAEREGEQLVDEHHLHQHAGRAGLLQQIQRNSRQPQRRSHKADGAVHADRKEPRRGDYDS